MENKVEQGSNVGEQPKQSTKPGIGFVLGCFMSLNAVNHIMVAVLTGYLVYISIGSTNVWNVHVLTCSVGYVLLMSEGIVALAEENVWSRWFTRRTNSHIHWILQAVGAVLSIYGTAIAIWNKEETGRPHFKSLHALTGIISVGFLIIAALLGLPALFAGRLRKVIKPVINKFAHNLLGTLCFIVGMVSMCYGYSKGWMYRNSTDAWREWCYWLTIIVTVLCSTGAAKSGGQQIWGILRLVRGLFSK